MIALRTPRVAVKYLEPGLLITTYLSILLCPYHSSQRVSRKKKKALNVYSVFVSRSISGSRVVSRSEYHLEIQNPKIWKVIIGDLHEPNKKIMDFQTQTPYCLQA